MLVDLYPRVHRRYTSLTILGPILDGYGTWLLKQGCAPASMCRRRLVSSAVYRNAECRL
ncbi:MAG: hypothetical protein OXG04_28450 [Acidobacteria bacterium]|nr:hypothetical protein [Acidobacteriota bacterium]